MFQLLVACVKFACNLHNVRVLCYVHMLACVSGCNPEQQMMYAGSMKSLVTEAGLGKVCMPRRLPRLRNTDAQITAVTQAGYH